MTRPLSAGLLAAAALLMVIMMLPTVKKQTQRGVYRRRMSRKKHWTPAFAGVTFVAEQSMFPSTKNKEEEL